MQDHTTIKHNAVRTHILRQNDGIDTAAVGCLRRVYKLLQWADFQLNPRRIDRRVPCSYGRVRVIILGKPRGGRDY